MKNNKIIQKLKPKINIKIDRIAIFDIETFKYNNNLYPYALGIIIESDIKIFYITDYYNGDFISASDNLLKAFVDYLDTLNKNYCLFAHNLGNFDGYFILKKILNKKPNLLIDDQNSLITISFKNNNNKIISFKDSYRILPQSLKELSKIYDVEHKKLSFDHNAVTIDLILNNGLFQNKPFKDSIIEYLTYDLLSLKEILFKISKYLLNNYNISLLDTFSTASMAMKIFRTKFMKNDIPILPKFYDKIIRRAYFGGIVNIIKPYGENLYYYDVNSLYPYSMKLAMPGKLIRRHFGQINLKNFFGFIYAQIIVPKHLNISHACTRINGELISPVGKFKGLYFSEELKAYLNWGYEVKTIFGFEHDKIYPFSEYVDHFYEIKKSVKGGERYITKLLLNGLYGFFGRKPVEELTEIIPTELLNDYFKKYSIHFYFIFEDYTVIKRDLFPSKELCEEFGFDYQEFFQKALGNKTTNSNVAITAAVTAYARIRIHNLIRDTGANLYYMDTDSMVTDKPIPNSFLSDELGYLKDELNGEHITEGYFVAPKVYGLQINNKSDPIIKAKSIKKGDISFNHIKSLYNGEILSFPVTRLFKDIQTLSLLEKSFTITISRDNTNSKRINLLDSYGKWVNTKPIILKERMNWYEYLMYKGKWIPKKHLNNLINSTLK